MPERPVVPMAGGQPLKVLTFDVAGESCALASDNVREIIQPLSLVQVPLAPPSLLGLASLRGEVLPVISLARVLGGEAGPDPGQGKVLVLDRTPTFALHVDEIRSFLDVVADDISLTTGSDKVLGVIRANNQSGAIRLLNASGLLPAVTAERRLQATSTHRASAADTVPSVPTQTIMAVAISGQEFALPIANVLEVLPALEDVTSLPDSDSATLGVALVRNKLVPTFSLRALLGYSENLGLAQRLVVATIGGTRFGLAVDEVTQIMTLAEDMFEPVPAVISSRFQAETRLQSIVRLDEGRRIVTLLAPGSLFGDHIMSRLPAETSTQEEATAGPNALRAFVIFTLGGQQFALPVEAVEEVTHLPEQISSLPQAPDFLKGVINLRGSVVPIIDQTKRFGMETGDSHSRRLVVVRMSGRTAGFVVESVLEVLRVDPAALAPPPEMAAEATGLTGVINLPQAGRMILMLDPESLLTTTERGLLETAGNLDEAHPPRDQTADR